MFAQRPIFRAFSLRNRYPKWCSDNLIARRLFAPDRYDFPIIRTPARRMTPRRVVHQGTILANGKRQIPESNESLGVSNVRGISFRAVGAKIPSQMNPLSHPAPAGFFSVEIQASVPLIPKFAPECAPSPCELRNRDTSLPASAFDKEITDPCPHLSI